MCYLLRLAFHDFTSYQLRKHSARELLPIPIARQEDWVETEDEEQATVSVYTDLCSIDAVKLGSQGASMYYLYEIYHIAVLTKASLC